MSIEVNIKEIELKREYPYLGIHKNNFIVLFTGDSTGFVVVTNSILYNIGEYNKFWNEDNFEIFVGEITLKNK